MPVKLISASNMDDEYVKNKSKKGRYSLKKFLNKSRFSPRFFSLSKRVSCSFNDSDKGLKSGNKSSKEHVSFKLF